MRTSPTQRTLAHCKQSGWPAVVVERWNEHAKMRMDLWGVIDLIVLDDEPGVLAVQACAGASHANRATKVRQTIAGVHLQRGSKASAAAADNRARALQKWLTKGNRIEVWSWSKKGARGKRKLWELRREPILSFKGIPIDYVESMETA